MDFVKYETDSIVDGQMGYKLKIAIDRFLVAYGKPEDDRLSLRKNTHYFIGVLKELDLYEEN